eukprot:6316318-Prorocentrum_lima.AAC.1
MRVAQLFFQSASWARVYQAAFSKEVRAFHTTATPSPLPLHGPPCKSGCSGTTAGPSVGRSLQCRCRGRAPGALR